MNQTTTTLEGDELLFLQLELVTPTTVAGTLYGLAFTLFCLYVHALVPRFRDKDRKRQAKFMLSYSAVIMLCGLHDLVANAWFTQDVYIKHGMDSGGPFVYLVGHAAFHNPFLLVLSVSQLIIDILTMVIQTKIWRVRVIWSATRYSNLVIVLPSLGLLTFVALRLRTIIFADTLPEAIVLQLGTGADIAAPAIQGAVTLLCTALISLFLIFWHWCQRKLIDNSQVSGYYMNIVAMLIESYALESIWLLISASLHTLSVVGIFFAETQTYIVIIAYLLVQYRVANGTAYESQNGQSRMSSLRWNHSNHATTEFEATTEAGDDRHVSTTKPRTSDASPISNMA